MFLDLFCWESIRCVYVRSPLPALQSPKWMQLEVMGSKPLLDHQTFRDRNSESSLAAVFENFLSAFNKHP